MQSFLRQILYCLLYRSLIHLYSNYSSPAKVTVPSGRWSRRIICEKRLEWGGCFWAHLFEFCVAEQTFNEAIATHCGLHCLRKEKIEGGKCIPKYVVLVKWLDLSGWISGVFFLNDLQGGKWAFWEGVSRLCTFFEFFGSQFCSWQMIKSSV